MKTTKFQKLVLAFVMTIGFIGIILTADRKEPSPKKIKIPTYGNLYQPTQVFLV